MVGCERLLYRVESWQWFEPEEIGRVRGVYDRMRHFQPEDNKGMGDEQSRAYRGEMRIHIGDSSTTCLIAMKRIIHW
eukprot:12914697-Prorocentrum_lima.AAC.1